MNNLETNYINISLGGEAHVQARNFAAQQVNTKKGKQVYLNTLAVYAVHKYLGWLQIESELQKSDSWQSGINSLCDFADLFIPNVGRLECRPVLPTQNYLTIPPQVSEERIGYVAVQFKENLDRVELIGFLPPVIPALTVGQFQQIPLSKLQSLESLLKRISQPSAEEISQTKPKITINLNRWWSERFEPSWLSPETLFKGNSVVTNPALRLRKEELVGANEKPIRVRRGKVIDLEDNLVVLVITCTLATQAETDIIIEVYPGEGKVYLPANLELMVLDETNTLVPELQVKSRNIDNRIQLSLSGEPGESFSVKLTLDRIVVTENFQL